ncbi:MAG: hypothetical protein WAO35_10380 [Terriglobia bacterium]
MRILGDLDGNESHEPEDPLRSKGMGNNGSHDGANASPASRQEPGAKDEQARNPHEQKDFATLELEKPRGDAFVGGLPPAHPPAQPSPIRRYGRRSGDRIAEPWLDATDIKHDRAQVSPRGSNYGLWFVVMVIALGLLGAGAYSYLSLRNNNVSLSLVPGLLQSVPVLGGRMNAAEAKLRDLAAKWDDMAEHMAKLDSKISSGLRASRHQTLQLVGQTAGRLQAEMEQQGKVMDARLDNVESMQKQDRAQLAELNDQLRGQVSSLRQQADAAQENTGHDLAQVQEQASNNQADLQRLAHNLHRDKVTFEIIKNSPTELAPGVTLTVLNTDTSYQRFRGYVSMRNEGKTLWLNNLSAKEAVDLYSQAYSHPYSLVVTSVNDDGVVGYLLLPAGA